MGTLIKKSCVLNVLISFCHLNGMLSSDDAELFKRALLFDSKKKIWNENKNLGERILIPSGNFKGNYAIIEKEQDFYGSFIGSSEIFKSAELVFCLKKEGFWINEYIRFSYLNKYCEKGGCLVADDFIQNGPKFFAIESYYELTIPTKTVLGSAAFVGMVALMRAIGRRE